MLEAEGLNIINRPSRRVLTSNVHELALERLLLRRLIGAGPLHLQADELALLDDYDVVQSLGNRRICMEPSPFRLKAAMLPVDCRPDEITPFCQDRAPFYQSYPIKGELKK